ncbi:MAG: DUF559 domain-containing protein [Verrucomicrobiota bacterium]
MNSDSTRNSLISSLKTWQRLEMQGRRDPLHFPIESNIGFAPENLIERFGDLDAAFGATLSMTALAGFDSRRKNLAAALELCDSPIEATFLLSFVCCCVTHDQAISVVDAYHEEVFALPGVHGDSILLVSPQLDIEPYAVDFGIEFTCTDPHHKIAEMFGRDTPTNTPRRFSERIAVECDGHNFHEKTPAQAAKDKRRDRFLLQNGYPVMRFTGSEIYRDLQRFIRVCQPSHPRVFQGEPLRIASTPGKLLSSPETAPPNPA